MKLKIKGIYFLLSLFFLCSCGNNLKENKIENLNEISEFETSVSVLSNDNLSIKTDKNFNKLRVFTKTHCEIKNKKVDLIQENPKEDNFKFIFKYAHKARYCYVTITRISFERESKKYTFTPYDIKRAKQDDADLEDKSSRYYIKFDILRSGNEYKLKKSNFSSVLYNMVEEDLAKKIPAKKHEVYLNGDFNNETKELILNFGSLKLQSEIKPYKDFIKKDLIQIEKNISSENTLFPLHLEHRISSNLIERKISYIYFIIKNLEKKNEIISNLSCKVNILRSENDSTESATIEKSENCLMNFNNSTIDISNYINSNIQIIFTFPIQDKNEEYKFKVDW